MNQLNTLASSSALSPLPEDEGDEISLLELLDALLEQKWLIALVTSIGLVIGGTYATLAKPVYEANTLIQIENVKDGLLGNLTGDLGSPFGAEPATSAEIQILQSRLVVGQAVSNLRLDLKVTPKYIPLIGSWLARQSDQPSIPDFFGLKGYVSGNESLQVIRFQVPERTLGQRYLVQLTTDGYVLYSPENQALGQAIIGSSLHFQLDGKKGKLLVRHAVGQNGTEFYVTANSLLTSTQALQTKLMITEQGKKSGVLSVSLEGTSPQQISRTLNEVGRLYIRQNVERKSAEAEKSIAFLDTQLPQLKRELETSENQLNAFREQKGTFDLNTEAQTLLTQSVNIEVKLLEAQQKREELLARFTTEHPTVQTLDSQIDDLRARIARLEHNAKSYPVVQQDLLRLTRVVKVNSELYANLLNGFQQLRLNKESKVADVRIIDPAVVPESPIKPKRLLILMLSGLAGLVLGAGLAFVRNSLRLGIRTADPIEKKLGLSIFATVPFSQKQTQLTAKFKANKPNQDIHLLSKIQPDDAAIESLRSLRTAVQFAMLDAPDNILLLTGPTPSVGKSFVSTNYAAVLASAGKRVLLIDADLRRGHIHQSFGLERTAGLSNLIFREQTLEQVLHKDIVSNLDFIATGTIPPNPAELLGSSHTRLVLEQLSKQYDIIVVDTPPVLVVGDTAGLARQAGTLLLVVRAEASTLGEVQEAVKQLARAGVPVKGIVFNGINIHRQRYSDKYRRYGYRYPVYRD